MRSVYGQTATTKQTKGREKIKTLYQVLRDIKNKDQEREIIRMIKQERKEGALHIKLHIKTPTPEPYKWKYIRVSNTNGRLYLYHEPLFKGYPRLHTPTRRENRKMANEQNVKRARQKVHDIVNANWTEYTKMLTLTYAKTQLDYDQLEKDFKAFMLNLKRRDIDKLPYLKVIEHQKKRGKKENNEGSLHFHVLFFTDKFIPYEDLKQSWGKRGSVDIKHIPSENKGKYVAKYINKETIPPDRKAYSTSHQVKRPIHLYGRTDHNEIEQDLKLFGWTTTSTFDYKLQRAPNQEKNESYEQTTVTVKTLSR